MTTTAPERTHPATTPRVEFCGIDVVIDRLPFTIGRDSDLALDDDNRYLHRRFLVLDHQRGMWTLANAGSQLTATVCDPARRIEAHLAPGGVLPLTSAATTIRFAAGVTSYELTVHLPTVEFPVPRLGARRDGEATMGRATLSPEQLLVVLVLAEPVLRAGHFVGAALPSNAVAAARLGWTITKFNRKLDAVCTKLADRGVRGLRGARQRLASNRRARLVEYAVTAQLATVADLPLLERYP